MMMFLLLLALAACESPGSRAEHKSYGLFLDRASPKMRAYLEADKALDAEERQDWYDFEATSRAVWQAREDRLNPQEAAKR